MSSAVCASSTHAVCSSLHGPQPVPPPRRMLDRYEVAHTLGAGLQGKVKLGIDTETQQRVALKIIDCAQLNRKSLINVYREIEAMSRVQHANVLQLLDVHQDVTYTKKNGTSKKVILIVLELATGGELFDFMMYTGCFSEPIARAYFQQLVRGLYACHAKGVYHRDIKPENLLLDERFSLKIADFGLSGLREGPDGAIAELYTQCGTRSYMSPEVLACLPYDGEPADVWSAGVVLFIMLAGFPPFQIATRQDWWFRACAAKQYEAFWAAHARSAVFSPGAMALMSRMFCVNPQERITLNEIMEDPWFQAPTITQEELVDDLLRRKHQVEEEKRREREEKLRKAQKHMEQEEEFDPFDMDVMRSVASSILSESDVSDSTSFASTVAPFASPKEQRASIAPLYPKESVALYTSFQSKKPAVEIQARIEKALNELSAQYVTKKERFRTKAVMKSENVAFAIRIFTLEECPDCCMVEVRRTRGNCFKFQDVYKLLVERLADLIWLEEDDKQRKESDPIEEIISDEAMMI